MREISVFRHYVFPSVIQGIAAWGASRYVTGMIWGEAVAGTWAALPVLLVFVGLLELGSRLDHERLVARRGMGGE